LTYHKTVTNAVCVCVYMSACVLAKCSKMSSKDKTLGIITRAALKHWK